MYSPISLGEAVDCGRFSYNPMVLSSAWRYSRGCLNTDGAADLDERVALIQSYQHRMAAAERKAERALAARWSEPPQRRHSDSYRLSEAAKGMLRLRLLEATRTMKRKADCMVDAEIAKRRREEGRDGPFFCNGKLKEWQELVEPDYPASQDRVIPESPPRSPNLQCLESPVSSSGAATVDWQQPITIEDSDDSEEIDSLVEDELLLSEDEGHGQDVHDACMAEWKQAVDRQAECRRLLAEARKRMAAACTAAYRARRRLEEWYGMDLSEAPWSDRATNDSYSDDLCGQVPSTDDVDDEWTRSGGEGSGTEQ